MSNSPTVPDCERCEQQASEPLPLIAIELAEPISEHADITSQPEAPAQPVPPGEDAAEVRVGLRLPVRVMDAVHVG